MSFSLKHHITHLPAQQHIGCCTASASLLAAEILLASAGRKERLSRLFVYYTTRRMKNRMGQNGAELRDTLDSMMQYGTATDQEWPFYVNRVNTEPNVAAFRVAMNYKIGSYEWAGSEAFKDYLHRGLPIIIGLHTGKLFWKLKGPLSEQCYKPINTTDNRNYRGHAVTIVGYDDLILGGSWIVGNSLGLTWGDHGFGILPYECVNDIGESYVITEFAGLIPGKKISEN